MANFSKKEFLIVGMGLVLGAGLGLLVYFGFTPGGGSANFSDGVGNAGKIPGTSVGSPAPDFELETLTGERIRLVELRDSVVMLNFWATWCGPCALEMPLIQERFEQNTPALRVLGINFAEPVKEVQDFVDQYGLTFDVLLDPEASVQQLYKVRGYPTTYVIDKEGIIRTHHIGIMSENQLDQYLENLGVGE